MKRFTSRKRTWILVGIVAVIAAMASFGAYAYWTTSGSGSGTATTGTDQGVTVTGDPANGLYPGSSVPVTTVVHNTSGQPQYVTNLHVTLSNDGGASCDPSWFTYKADSEASGTDSNPHTVALNTEIPASTDYSVAGHVYMADPNTNQDACKTVTLTLDYQVDNS